MPPNSSFALTAAAMAGFAVFAPWITSCYLGHFAIIVWPIVIAAIAKLTMGSHSSIVAAALAISSVGKGNEYALIAAVAPAVAGWSYGAWTQHATQQHHQLSQSVLDSV